MWLLYTMYASSAHDLPLIRYELWCLNFYSDSVEKESEQVFWETGSAVTASMIRRFFIEVIVDMCIMATQRLQNCVIAKRVTRWLSAYTYCHSWSATKTGSFSLPEYTWPNTVTCCCWHLFFCNSSIIFKLIICFKYRS